MMQTTSNPDKHHQLLTVSYDANGNTTRNTTRNTTNTFTYGDNNRLKTSGIGGSTLATYTYNGRGERVKKDSGGIIYYHYDQVGQLIAETDMTGVTQVEYIYLDGQPLALISNNAVYYYHNDHLGTPQLITDSNQATVWQADYDPFGAATVDLSSTITNNLRFPGQYYDAETNLHYNYFRYYDPQLGRYITSDRIGLDGGINTYLYALANPIRYIDPLGLFPGSGGSITDLPAWIPEWGSGAGGDPSGGTSGSSGSGGSDECDNQEEEDCLQEALNLYSVETSINRIAGFGIGTAIAGGGAQGLNKTAIKHRIGIAGGGPSGRYTSYTRRFFGRGFGRSIGRASIGSAAKVTGILGAGVAAWSLHGEALLIYLKCLEENR